MEHTAKHTTKYLRFQVGSQWYGISIDRVREVSYLMLLNELPATDASVLGLMTMRDEVIPVIDLRIRFGATESRIQARHADHRGPLITWDGRPAGRQR